MNPGETPVDLKGLAAALGEDSTESLRQMAVSGQIPGFRFGPKKRLWRFYVSEVITALNPPHQPWSKPTRSRGKR